MPTDYNPPLSGAEEKDYYDKSEAALRTMSKYDHPNHNAPQYQPGGEKKPGCPLMIIVLASPFILGAIAIAQFI